MAHLAKTRNMAFAIAFSTPSEAHTIAQHLNRIPPEQMFIAYVMSEAKSAVLGFLQHKKDASLTLQSWRNKIHPKLDSDADYTAGKRYEVEYYTQKGMVVECGKYRPIGSHSKKRVHEKKRV